MEEKQLNKVEQNSNLIPSDIPSERLLNQKIIITGGGSGGHISPAKAILDELLEKYSNAREQILYVGSNLGMEGETGGKSLEQKMFENSDINFIAIRAGKLQRYFSWRTLELLGGVFGGFIDAMRVFKQFKPDLVISTGGYVTVPVCFVAWLKKVPVYVHEQTAAVGLTNKITSKFAEKVFITFKQSEKYFPKGKTLHTGNAVRKAIFKTNGKGEVVDAVAKMVEVRSKTGKPIIAFFGGGQGSHLINITVRQMLTYLLRDYQVLIQTGDNTVNKDYDVLMREREKLPADLKASFYPFKFVSADEIGNLYANIDMYIGRAGANFVYEMGVLKIPSIFIPIPWVTHNEQFLNAKVIEELGFGMILPEGELTAERLFNEVNKFWARVKGRAVEFKGLNTSGQFPVDAVERILEEISL
ncbi:MAG: undecaprenyldiphospho-muramoylpentapeptide beta-N-acetylglucosaminyltransferase [Candidatus Dojkabacteria bacterium]